MARDTELNWDVARQWQSNANEKNIVGQDVKWRFDCGFKLDFDGPLLSINSRFYPPHKNTGDFWEGVLKVYLLDEKIREKEFMADTLDELKQKVEKFTKHYIGILRHRLR